MGRLLPKTPRSVPSLVEASKPVPLREDMPSSWRRFARRYPNVADAYNELSETCRVAGPLKPEIVALLKLAVSVGAHMPRTIHRHTKKALLAGATPNEARQVALVALPTVGLPAAMDALEWIDEIVTEAPEQNRGRCGKLTRGRRRVLV